MLSVCVVMQLLIGFETGLIVLWDLREKTAEFRYNATEVCIEYTLVFLSVLLHSYIAYNVLLNHVVC